MIIDLDGKWRLDGRSPDGAQSLSLDAVVPGHVHLDLMREKKIEDPFWRDNAEACQWVEEWEWTYSRDFDISEAVDLSWAELEFDGLDTYATIILNGRQIAQTATMFVPHKIDATGILRAGKNTLTVRFSTISSMVAGKRLDYPCAFDNTERVHVRRMQCTFGWDWVHRFVSYGIWQPVRILLPDRARFTDCHAGTSSLEKSRATLDVSFTADCRTSEPVSALISIAGPDGKQVWSTKAKVSSDETRLSAKLESPKLWWPAGYGEQPLYHCRFDMMDSQGALLDRREFEIGIRTVALISEDDKPGSPEWEQTMALRAAHPNRDGRNGDEPGRSYQIVVNGELIFCKGGNWVPADPWPSRITPDWYNRLLEVASRGNINCLRVWGGGIYEPEPFWQACDRLGILICQDFMMACAHYPEDDEGFLDLIRLESPIVVRRLRNHASLGWWSGDNENRMHQDEFDPASPGWLLSNEITGPICHDLDPHRPFVPSSPYGGKPNSCLTVGDAHFTGIPWTPEDEEREPDYRKRIEKAICRFNSECAMFAAPEMSALTQFMSSDDLAEIPSPIWYYHTKDNPYMPIRIFDLLKKMSDGVLGQSESPEKTIERLQYIGYEYVRLTIEAARRKKWYNSGVLFWMFNDCWPATDWSLVDYYGTAKAPLYAMMHAARPVMGCIEDAGDSYRLWVCNDTLFPFNGEARVRVQPWQGDARCECTQNVQAPPNSSVVVKTIPKANLNLGDDAVIVFDLTSVAGVDRSWLYAPMPSQMAPPHVVLSATVQHGAITISAATYARVVTLQGNCDFSDNYFDLLPGEERVIQVSPRSKASEIEVTVRCWNQEGAPLRVTVA